MIRSKWIYVAAWLFLPMTAWAEEQPVPVVADDMLRDDYISASLLVISPSVEVYSLVGHCALRLECPSKQMDYCFTFETSTDTQGIVRFLMGSARGGFLASQTGDYLAAYREAGRGVTAYPLHLTPQEELRLWQAVDEEMARGYRHPYGYLHTQCTSMIVSLLSRAVEGNRIVYHEPADIERASFRDMMLTASSSYPWSTFFWQTVLGPDGDDTTPIAHKLTPQLLPEAWQRATVGSSDRHLVENSEAVCLISLTENIASTVITPLALFSLLLVIIIAITVGQRIWGWRLLPFITDAVLITAHTLVSLFLASLWLFSRQEGTSWNWYLVAFNLLPLALCIALPAWRMHILGGTLALVALQLLLTPFIPQLDLPHGIASACLAPRLTFHLTNIIHGDNSSFRESAGVIL